MDRNKEMDEYKKHIRQLEEQYEQWRLGLRRADFSEEDISALIHHWQDESKVQKCRQLLQWAIQRYPFSSDLLVKQADILIAEEQYQAAALLLEKVEVLDKNNPNALILRYELLLLENNTRAAQTLLLTQIPHCSRAEQRDIYYDIIAILKDLKRPDTAELLLEIIAAHNDSLSFFWHRLPRCIRKKDYPRCIQTYKQLLDKNAFHCFGWLGLGKIYSQMQQHLAAIDCYEYAYSLHPNASQQSKIARMIFQACLHSKNKALIQKYFSRLQPDWHAEQLIDNELCGHYYYFIKDFQAAKTAFLQRYRLSATLPKSIAEKMLRIYIREKDFAGALEWTQLTETAAPAPLLRAYCYERSGRYSDALFYYLKALKRRPYSRRLWCNYLRFMCAHNELEAALQQVQQNYKTTEKSLFLFLVSGLSYLCKDYNRAPTYFSLAQKHLSRPRAQKEVRFLLQCLPALTRAPFVRQFLSASYE